MASRSLHLLDLHQNLLVTICRGLSTRDKIQLRLVCKSFHSLLDDPAPGSGIWGVVDLCDFKADSAPLKLYWWLLKRAAGIQTLQYVSRTPLECLVRAIRVSGNDVMKQELITRVLPRLARILPEGTEAVLDLRWATVQCLFARDHAPPSPEYMSQYWGALSAHLTKLKITFNEDVEPATVSALNRLTQLKGLLLEGFEDNAVIIRLQLSKLTKLTLMNFGKSTISLDCPQLKSLKLINLDPLQEMSRLPEGLDSLRLSELADGSMPVEQMLPAEGWKHLSSLALHDCPGDPVAVRKAYDACKLLYLSIGQSWAALLPTQPPWQGLPCHLQTMELWHPLDNGIPLVLEQLDKLQALTVTHIGAGPLHLTRPLDPFLDMASLTYLFIHSDKCGGEDLERWTPDALGVLGLADIKRLRMARVPGGRTVQLFH